MSQHHPHDNMKNGCWITVPPATDRKPKLIGKIMSTLALFQAAVAAKLAYWNASRDLELALGLDDVPDAVDDEIQNSISDFACLDGGPNQEELDELVERVNKLMEDAK